MIVKQGLSFTSQTFSNSLLLFLCPLLPLFSVHGLPACPSPMNSSAGGSHSSAIVHRRKRQNSTLATLLRRHYGILQSDPPFGCNLHKKKTSFVAGISSPVNFRLGFPKSQLSARKLAAGLWQLRFAEDPSGNYGGDSIGDGSVCSPKSALANENLRIEPPTHHETRDELEKMKDPTSSPPHTILHSRKGIQHELESYVPCLKCCKEEATKWDAGLPDESNEFTHVHGVKRTEERNLLGRDSIVSALLAELFQAQSCINKLKASRKSSKRKTQHFVQKYEKEMTLWKQRELQKFRSMLAEVEDKLGGERRSRERMELMNAKLIHKLAEGNRFAKHFKKKYEEEKRGRELMEEVCNELAKQIGEDKGRLEQLEMESMKILNEVEEERKMMQIAELLREERVQMKLVDAKLALEDKYNQMTQFFSLLQNSLIRPEATADQLAKNNHIVELSYDFLDFDDVFSIYEELRNNRDREEVIKPYEDDMDKRSNSSSDCDTGLQVVRVNQEGCDKSPDTEVTGEVLKRKASCGSELRRSISNGRTSSLIEGVLCSSEGSGFRNWESEAMNPHITRAMKGCIENWPRGGVPKSILKAVSLDARVRSQRSQLQHILKSKA